MPGTRSLSWKRSDWKEWSPVLNVLTFWYGVVLLGIILKLSF